MDLPRPPAPPLSIPPQKLDELVQAMAAMRNNFLKVSFLLRDHLDETDLAARAQAYEAATALIRQCRKG